jgi:hypothetical protein
VGAVYLGQVSSASEVEGMMGRAGRVLTKTPESFLLRPVNHCTSPMKIAKWPNPRLSATNTSNPTAPSCNRLRNIPQTA